MSSDPNSFVRRCIALMFDPVAAFCVARGVHFQDFLELAKASFVRSASRQLEAEKKELSVSKLSVMTGIQRPEVARITAAGPSAQSKDFVTRVIGQWVSDKRFLDKKRNPRTLSIEGRKSDFARLVHTVSKDLNPHTVRFELERLELVRCGDNRLILMRPAYISTGDPAQTFLFGAEDVRDILASVQENAFAIDDVPNLHARTQYDNVPDEALPEIRNWFLEVGKRIHGECREYLSKFDRDISGKSRGSGRNRVVLGTFSRIETFDQEDSKSEDKK